jgi:hypothetical protein
MSAFRFLVVLGVAAASAHGFDFESMNGDDFEIIDPYMDASEARFLNVSNIFNSSLISIVAIFIGGIILFGENKVSMLINFLCTPP